MNKNRLVILGTLAFLLHNSPAQAVLVESWENTLDGWTLSPENPAYSAAFSSTLGVTDQSFSLALTGTAGPTYGQLLDSPSTLAFTAMLANASTLSIDVYTPSGSFGFFQQWALVINNADTGFSNLDPTFSHSPSIGSQSTLTWTIPASIRTTLSTSANPSQIIFQVGGGFTSGNETMYLDNVQITPVPEPSVMALMGAGATGLAFVARRRANKN
jgi:hypothetical protein